MAECIIGGNVSDASNLSTPSTRTFIDTDFMASHSAGDLFVSKSALGDGATGAICFAFSINSSSEMIAFGFGPADTEIPMIDVNRANPSTTYIVSFTFKSDGLYFGSKSASRYYLIATVIYE